MAALVDQVVAGAGSHRWPHGSTSGERPWLEDAADVVDNDVEDAVPLALALIPAKGTE